MERTMTVEEKIRRAEEIYSRRNGTTCTYQRSNPKIKKGPSLMQRMLKQIIICFMIYGIFYVVNNKEYYLSQEFQTKVEQIASKNETTQKAYNWLTEYIQKYIYQQNNSNNEEKPKTTNTQNNSNEENNPPQAEETTSNLETNEPSNDENIGGSSEETNEVEKTQEQKDIEKVKTTTSFIKPIEGTISSTFGWRTPTTATVPKYHTGLDIAAKTGTKIKSATDGKIILASSEGDYGNHYKIQIDDIILVYAHCSKLYFNEGDNVAQGQEIAEVGSTGNSTRTTPAF